MAQDPVLSGEIPSSGFLELLREIEGRRITGCIRFTANGKSGEVKLVQGQVVPDEERKGDDPLELLLSATSGQYSVHFVLPPLPLSHGGPHARWGSLGVHSVPDLMNYCESTGLSGVLELRKEGRWVEIVYRLGELLAIRIDGREKESGLDEIFNWDEGTFRIEYRGESEVNSLLPPPPSDSVTISTHHTQADEREPTLRYTRSGVRGQIKSAPLEGPSNLLNIVEMALVDVISAKERSQSKRHSLASAPHQRQPKNTQEKQNRNTKIPVMWLDGKEATIPKAPQKNTTPPNPTHKVESESAPQQPKQSPSQSQDTKEPTPNVIENNHEDNHEENAKAVVEPTQWAALILFAFAMVVGGIALLRLIIS